MYEPLKWTGYTTGNIFLSGPAPWTADPNCEKVVNMINETSSILFCTWKKKIVFCMFKMLLQLKGIWSETKALLFCNCPCAFNSTLFKNMMIFYLNLSKAVKFALKVIDMIRPALNLQLGLGNEIWGGSCIDNLVSAIIAKKSKQNIAKDEYLNLLFDFLALFVPGEDRKYCWVQLPTS